MKRALVVGHGGFESYGFHCLELLQAFVEKRPGGETGVKAVQALEGDAADAFLAGEAWSRLQSAAVATVPESSRRAERGNRRGAGTVFRVEYADGFEAAVCISGQVSEFCFAADVAGRPDPVATYALLPKPQRDHFSFLCNHVEYMFRSGEPSYPVERTLLTTGVLDALHDSRQAGGKTVATPHLMEVRYTPVADFA